jgi:site-specific DNA-methyltransferase (adenine-specific)
VNDKVNVATTDETQHWCTPDNVLECVRKIAEIELDPCSNANSLVRARVSIELPNDGLAADWIAHSRGGLVYVNPPYGRAIPRWTSKCAIESTSGVEIVALLPARTDTKWFQKDVFWSARAVCFWAGRIKFVGSAPGASAPFPSALVYYGARPAAFVYAFADVGRVVLL